VAPKPGEDTGPDYPGAAQDVGLGLAGAAVPGAGVIANSINHLLEGGLGLGIEKQDGQQFGLVNGTINDIKENILTAGGLTTLFDGKTGGSGILGAPIEGLNTLTGLGSAVDGKRGETGLIGAITSLLGIAGNGQNADTIAAKEAAGPMSEEAHDLIVQDKEELQGLDQAGKQLGLGPAVDAKGNPATAADIAAMQAQALANSKGTDGTGLGSPAAAEEKAAATLADALAAKGTLPGAKDPSIDTSVAPIGPNAVTAATQAKAANAPMTSEQINAAAANAQAVLSQLTGGATVKMGTGIGTGGVTGGGVLESAALAQRTAEERDTLAAAEAAAQAAAPTSADVAAQIAKSIAANAAAPSTTGKNSGVTGTTAAGVAKGAASSSAAAKSGGSGGSGGTSSGTGGTSGGTKKNTATGGTGRKSTDTEDDKKKTPSKAS
jgi:hypothetical protein